MKHNLDQKISAITLKIKRGDWELFKQITPRTISLNEALVALIHREIVKNTKSVSDEEIADLNRKGRPAHRYVVVGRKKE